MSNVTFVVTFFSLVSAETRVNRVEETVVKSRRFIDALKQSKNLIHTPTAKLRHTTHEHLLFSPSCLSTSSSSQRQQKASSSSTTVDCVGGLPKASAALICVPGATNPIPRARLITMWADYVCIVDLDDETKMESASSATTPNTTNAPSPRSGVAEETEKKEEEEEEDEREKKKNSKHEQCKGQISDILLVMAAARSSHVPVLIACRSIGVFNLYVELAQSRRDLRGLAVYWLELREEHSSPDAHLITSRCVVTCIEEMASSLLTALSLYCPPQDFFGPSSQTLVREEDLLWEVDPALAVQRVSSALTPTTSNGITKKRSEYGMNDDEIQKENADESSFSHPLHLHLRSPLVRDFSIRCALPLRLSYITSFGQQQERARGERGGRGGRGGRGCGAVGSSYECRGRGMGAVAHLCYVVQGTLRVGDRLVTGVPDSYMTRDLGDDDDDEEGGGGIVRESNEIVLEIRPYPSFSLSPSCGPTLNITAAGCATDAFDECGDRVDSLSGGGGGGVFALSSAVSGQFVTIVTTNTRAKISSSQHGDDEEQEEEIDEDAEDARDVTSSVQSEAGTDRACMVEISSSAATTKTANHTAANKKAPLPRGGRRGKRKPRTIWDMRTGGDVHEWQSVPCLFTRFDLSMGTLLCRPGRGALQPAWLASFNVVGDGGKPNKRLLRDARTPTSRTPTTTLPTVVAPHSSSPTPSSPLPPLTASPIIKPPLLLAPSTACTTDDTTVFKLSDSDVARASLITKDGVVTHRSLYLVREEKLEKSDDGEDEDETEKERKGEGDGGSSSSSSRSRSDTDKSYVSSDDVAKDRYLLMYESVSKGSSARCDAVTLDTHLHCLPSVVNASNMYACCSSLSFSSMRQKGQMMMEERSKTLLDSTAMSEDNVSREGDKKEQDQEQAFEQQQLEEDKEEEEEEYKGWQKALLVVNHPTRRNEIIQWFIVAIREKVPKIQVARAVASCLRAHGSKKVPPHNRPSPRSAVPIAPLYPPQLFDERVYDLTRFCERSFLLSLHHDASPPSPLLLKDRWLDPYHREAAAALLLLIHPLPLAYWRSHSLLVSSSSDHSVVVDFTNGFPEDKGFLSPFVLMMDMTAASTTSSSERAGEGLFVEEPSTNTYTNDAKTVTTDGNGRTCCTKSVFGRDGHIADVLAVLSNMNLYLTDDLLAQRSSGGAYGGGGAPFFMHTANGGTRLEDALYLRHKGSCGAADKKPLRTSTAIFQEEVILGAIARAIRSSRHALRILLEAASPLSLSSLHSSLCLVRDAQRAALESIIDDVPFVRTFEQNINNPNLFGEEWGKDPIGDSVRNHMAKKQTRKTSTFTTRVQQEDEQVVPTSPLLCNNTGNGPRASPTQKSLSPHHTALTTTIRSSVLSKTRHKRCLFTALLSHMISPMPGESPSDVYIPQRVRDFIIGNYFPDPRGPARYEERTLYYTLRSFRTTGTTTTGPQTIGHVNCGGDNGGSNSNVAQNASSGDDGDSLGVSAALVPRRVLPPHILLHGLLCPYQNFAAAAVDEEEEKEEREGSTAVPRLAQNTLSDFLYMPDYTGLELFALCQKELMELKFSMGKGYRDRISSGTVLILRSETTLRRWAASSCLDFLFDSDVTKHDIAPLLVDVSINGKGNVLFYRPSSVEDYDTMSRWNKKVSQQCSGGRGRGRGRALSGGRGGEGGGGGPIIKAVETVQLHAPRTEERMRKAYHDNKWPLLSSSSCFPLLSQKERADNWCSNAKPIVLVEANVSALIRMYCFIRALSSVAAAVDNNCGGDGVYGHDEKEGQRMRSTNTETSPTSENSSGQVAAIRQRKAAFLTFSPRILQTIFSFLN